VDRLLRANIGAGGIVAMATQVHLKTKFQFITNQPGAILRNGYQLGAFRRAILLLASHLARLTAPAQVMLYFNLEIGHNVCLYFVLNIEEKNEIRTRKDWILFLVKHLDRIYRINRIFVRFPDETVQTSSASGG